jgi:hypothetical protein
MKSHLSASLSACLLATLCADLGRAADPADVRIEAEKDRIDFYVGKDLVTRYHLGPDLAKPYLWPLHAPGGIPVTRAWPMEEAKPGGSTDHVHQKSAWFCHGDVIPEGLALKQKIKGIEGVDFWSEQPGHGTIVCVQVGEPKVDGHHGQIATVNEWRTADGVKILDETRILHLYDLGEARLLVFEIELRAQDYTITFGDTKEGALGVRVRDELNEEKGKGRIENAEGKKSEKECWGRVSAWCDYAGPLEGKSVGLAILDDPANPPACWHSRGYGLMAANPFGRTLSGFPSQLGKTDLVKLAKGDKLRLRYGLLLHKGDAKEGRVEEEYQKFVKLRKSGE